MQYIKTIIISVCLSMFSNVKAQLSTNERPVSFDGILEQSTDNKAQIPVVTMPMLDMEKLFKEDEEDEKKEIPPRFGYPHKVNYDLNNSGIWRRLPNGDKIWQLNVVCPEALTINFLYDKFWLPEGGKFFIYTKDRKHSIGAFTSRNNKGDRENIRGFATGRVHGDDVILEYYQPKEVVSDAIISIDYVVHGYRDIYLRSGTTCQVGVNCADGQPWQNEKKAVAVILVQGHRTATGELVNTTYQNQAPVFLTANHNINLLGGDAQNNPNLDCYSFEWNYETLGCEYSYNDLTESITTSGATILANDSLLDFALLRLTEDPQYLLNYTPYYLGWDRTGLSGSPGVCIHHPHVITKKIATVASQPVSTTYKGYTELSNGAYWKVTWATTNCGHGVVDVGSSGSALLSGEHKVLGQLRGGFANCEDSINAPDWYGKLSVSWTNNNNSSIYRRLDYWLDPLNTGIQTIEGLLIIPSDSILNTDQEIYGSIRITSTGKLTIQSEVEMRGNSCVIIESGGKLIIDGGKLSNVDVVIKSGASLQIINGGVIDIRDSFVTNLGATVDIGNGQIL